MDTYSGLKAKGYLLLTGPSVHFQGTYRVRKGIEIGNEEINRALPNWRQQSPSRARPALLPLWTNYRVAAWCIQEGVA